MTLVQFPDMKGGDIKNRACKIKYQVKAMAAQPNHLNSSSGLQDGRRGEPTPASCPLTLQTCCAMSMSMQYKTHREMNK